MSKVIGMAISSGIAIVKVSSKVSEAPATFVAVNTTVYVPDGYVLIGFISVEFGP